ncbi:hypothetical protein BDK51DRAFT_31154 [Blyttiomyces helicus]|uniref:Uncharacterized protein n=1 Tax=Blyttiomyces helicus TaxID=388810 RepID=A0A4P9WI92_9FUNG|nr:hypothetical protein BDK51DRAFT_31154 [Blyttiomyces helicus]|eukprot:RKO91158.1 hypothetical protein BDK51DRAFT_31154 [Blyttiomyces helicus]
MATPNVTPILLDWYISQEVLNYRVERKLAEKWCSTGNKLGDDSTIYSQQSCAINAIQTGINSSSVFFECTISETVKKIASLLSIGYDSAETISGSVFDAVGEIAPDILAMGLCGNLLAIIALVVQFVHSHFGFVVHLCYGAADSIRIAHTADSKLIEALVGSRVLRDLARWSSKQQITKMGNFTFASTYQTFNVSPVEPPTFEYTISLLNVVSHGTLVNPSHFEELVQPGTLVHVEFYHSTVVGTSHNVKGNHMHRILSTIHILATTNIAAHHKPAPTLAATGYVTLGE